MPVRTMRRRYFAFMLNTDATIDRKSIYKLIKTSINRFYGTKGIMDSYLKLIEYNEETKTGILRCAHIFKKSLRASLAMITEIDSIPVSVHVLKTSGTIKSLRKKLILMDKHVS